MPLLKMNPQFKAFLYIPKSHLNLCTSFTQILNKVLLFTRIDSDHTQQKVTRCSQRHLDFWRYNVIDCLCYICLEHVWLCEFLVPVGSKPYFGQRALLWEDKMSIKHDFQMLAFSTLYKGVHKLEEISLWFNGQKYTEEESLN